MLKNYEMTNIKLTEESSKDYQIPKKLILQLDDYEMNSSDVINELTDYAMELFDVQIESCSVKEI